jgi:exopolysaccharide biosynthesis polyprenyl glycosylphosphotransferase
MSELSELESTTGFAFTSRLAPSAGWIPLRPADVASLSFPAAPVSQSRLSMRRWAMGIALTDAAVVVGIVGAAVFLRFGDIERTNTGLPFPILPLVMAPVWVVALWLAGSYDVRVLPSGTEEYRRVVNASIWVLAGVGFTAFALQANVSRTLVALSFPMATIATLISRALARALLRIKLKSGSAIHRAVVIGGEEQTAELVSHIRAAPHLGFSVVRAYLPVAGYPHQANDLGAATMDGPDALIADLRLFAADTIAIADADAFAPGGLRRLSWALEGTGITLLVAPRLTDVAGPRIVVRPAQGLPLLEIEEPEFHGANRLLKELIDRLAAVVLLTFFTPVMLVTAAAIKLSSKGPVFYRQQRVGQLGNSFRIWKFRTMTIDAESRHHQLLEAAGHDGILFKLADDPRVTPVGRFLRRYSIDELPQLLNVLFGSMSLVGPRPQRPLEVEQYAEHHRRRLLVKPGMTGLWQISGRSGLSWEEALQLDLHYVDNWSVTRDLLILVKTVWAVFGSTGAY